MSGMAFRIATLKKLWKKEGLMGSVASIIKNEARLVFRHNYPAKAINHRFIKKITKPMMGFKAFHSAQATTAGIETAHMIRKGQLSEDNIPAYKQFIALALKPIIGFVIFLINRWSCSIILFKYLTWHMSIIVANPARINKRLILVKPAYATT
jgi:hypothetical protein